MNIHDLVNYTAAPPTPRGAPAPAAAGSGAAQPVTSGAFITPQSLVSFPFAAGVVVGLWKGIQALFPAWGPSPWIALVIAFLVGGLVTLISISDGRLNLTQRQTIIAAGVAFLNCFYLFMAALGINPK